MKTDKAMASRAFEKEKWQTISRRESSYQKETKKNDDWRQGF